MNSINGKSTENNRVGTCKFYILRKKRHCKFGAVPNQEYCSEHLPKDDTGEFELKGRKRIPCPYDSKHSVFETKLQSHLRKCNARPIKQGPYHLDGINNGDIEDQPKKRLLVDVPIAELKSLIRKIEELYERYVKISDSIQEHPILRSDLNNPEHQKCLKHRKQEASLLGNMSHNNWLNDGTIYAEFGAGRARLAAYLIEAVSDQLNSHLVLIDRDHARNKCENKFKESSSGPSFERLRIDIKDLKLEDHPVIKASSKPIIAYSKHLCGSATDLTLRCLERLVPSTFESGEAPQEKRSKVDEHSCWMKGIQIALCCHHRCEWSSYYGKEFWKKTGLTPDEFIIVRALTGWATCAFPQTEKNCEEVEHQPQDQESTEDADRYRGLDREDIGIKCKRILDYGRLDALQNLGYRVGLVKYTSRDVSLENVMLFADK